MKKTFTKYLVLCALWALVPLCAAAQELFNVSYKEQSIEQVIADIRRKTGYDFVYQKQVVEGVAPVTCTYRGATLTQLLDRIFWNEAGLDYEIVDRTVILSQRKDDETEFFKRLITGVVVDEQGEPLVGASVTQSGSSLGTATDLDGAFSLLVDGRDPSITVAYMGMKPQALRVRSQKEGFFYVQMESDATMMDEIIVTGYQNMKRENATGSYQLITSKDMESRYSGSIVENLEGKIPGLVSYKNGLNEGGESAMTIRGAGSFNARTNPLVVVDGLPIEGSIETVNPYDIENITVLKDAAAAAIYGARASNGVIVITTKRAHDEKLAVEFSTDITVSQRNDYSNFNWANAEEMIRLERYNFDYVTGNDMAYSDLLSTYQSSRHTLSPVSRLLLGNRLGEVDDATLNSTLARWARNDYRKEWQRVMERPEVLQQYNLALRTQGKVLSSSVVLNYRNDNAATAREYNRDLTFSYRGNLNVARWLDIAFGANIINNRSKSHIGDFYNSINSFAPYQSMYEDDGSRAAMEADVWLGEEALQDESLGLKDVSYNLLDEVGRNFNRARSTNIRSYVHADFTILPEWTVSGQFQYEDIYTRRNRYYEAESYTQRYNYNLYTTRETVMEWVEDPSFDWDSIDWDDPNLDWETVGMMQVANDKILRYLPDGGRLDTYTSEQAYYTFRAQTNYAKTFGGRHSLDLMAGLEYRSSQTRSNSNVLMGYDDQTQTNNNNQVNWGVLQNLNTVSAMGSNYYAWGLPYPAPDFTTTDVLHRFFSYYFTGNYVYDNRYAATFSARVDNTDLFGADPKFRRRPLWSAGLSWNIHNEAFMAASERWLDALKLRATYGLTGNIDSSVSSYLTATIDNEFIYGNKVAVLDTPPNDQLRWEKTASWNAGVDFSMWNNRLSGSLDWYRKYGSDLLSEMDLDPTTGWNRLTINNGEVLNTGVEVQLNGDILRPRSRREVGISASLNFSYNRNEVKRVDFTPKDGYTAMQYYSYRAGYPIHSLFSWHFAGLTEVDGIQFYNWTDADGGVHNTDVSMDTNFTQRDVVFSGSLDPKYVGSFTPEITWRGFRLSAMFTYFGGHVMRARTDDWSMEGNAYGYSRLSSIPAVPRSFLDYWESGDATKYPANGYPGHVVSNLSTQYMDANVVPADYLKLRTLLLEYSFPRRLCAKIGAESLRLRLQANNLCTWARNRYGIDPEANSAYTGAALLRTPRSFTMSLHINF